MKKFFEKVKRSFASKSSIIKVIMSLAIILSTVIAMGLANSVTSLIIPRSSDPFEENL